MTKYRIALIGCGSIAAEHARAWLSLGNVELIAGAEIAPNAPPHQKFKQRHQLPRMYADYRKLLASEHPDIVSVCTYPRTHCEIVVAAAEAGAKAILCEKPMAISLDEADRMLAACADSGTTLAVGHHHRFAPQSQKARSLLDAGEIGQPTFIWGHCCLDLMNNGSHVIDLVNYLNGDVPAEWIMGQIDMRHLRRGRMNHPDLPSEDMAIVHVKYRNGLEACIELGDWSPPHYRFRIIGSEGMMDINAPGAAPLRVMSQRQPGWCTPPLDAADPRIAEMRELIDAMEQKREHLSSGRRARAAVEIAIGAFESARRGGLLECPLDVTDFPLDAMFSARAESRSEGK